MSVVPNPIRPASVATPMRIVGAAGMIALAALLAYQNSFQVPLLLDDFGAIATNPTIQRLWPLEVVLNPPSTVGTAGRPLANFSFAINFALGGGDFRGYHALNLAIHVLAGLTLFGIVRRTLLRLRAISSTPGSRADELAADSLPLAFTIALLWTAHPLQTISVTYLSQRTESLMGLCYLATLYGFIRGTEPDGARSWWPFSVAMCFLGMASKEVMVTAPLLILLYDRTFVGGNFRAALRERRRYYGALALSLVLLALLLRGLADRKVGFGIGVTWWSQALTQCEAILTYLRLAIWPHPLVFDYGPHFRETLRAALPFAIPLAALLAATGLLLRARPKLGFCAGCFFMLLAPTSSVVPVALQPIAENRTYLPLAPVLALLVLGVYSCIGRRSFGLLAGVGLGCIALTFQRNATYHDPFALCADTIAKRPLNPRAYDSYGQMLKDAGRAAEAIPYLQHAIALNPASAASHGILGDCFLALGRLPEALSTYAKTLELNPRTDSARINYGLIFFRTGRPAEAIAEFEQVLRYNPDHAVAHHNLALCLGGGGRKADAAKHYLEALRIQPGDAGTHYDYAALLTDETNWPLAEKHFRAALRLRPDWPEAHHGLGISLYNSRRTEEAIVHLERALQLNPNFTHARNNLERIRAIQGLPAK
ncbi:MAG: tetratricopeptide repeat protein [Opitutus sp.]|nr:tetratricopeptide repeat protein [Opitutus sp.]